MDNDKIFSTGKMRQEVNLADGWWIRHPGTMESIQVANFQEAMTKWFEGFNHPFYVDKGLREPSNTSHDRVTRYLAQ